ncbi:hypothetical protein G6O69_22780 [Pseudenhygromyxa sp. WMMC2535]|uniref:hypothetical protein n=1 Tax=Pseudenhygromyxa sp. WMMC2535 TaxID=2712867 RepID=UPI00155624E6|nr:hypothetical protein [Pseudenhygromyxa sp. WMMC2535]NVB40682.1 hypothetical protein [Pseudenhygromyxa sp. WMMC2535]
MQGSRSRDPHPRVRIQRSALVGLSLASLLGCVDRPSQEECQAMVDHVAALFRAEQQGRAAEIASEVASEHGPELLDECREAGTAREVRCVLEAATLDEVRACAPAE